MDNEKAEIKVHNIQDKDKKNYLGSIQFDLQRIYNENKDHAIHGQWIGLFNYENEENNQVNGFLRISLSIQHESDKKIILLPASTQGKGNVMLPPQLKQNMSFSQLALYFFEANNIPNMDTDFTWTNEEDYMFAPRQKKECQGFIEVEYGGIILQTKVCDMRNDRITWDQCIRIPIPEPRVSDKLFIRLFDKDLTRNQLIGTYELNLEEVIPSVIKLKSEVSNKFKAPKKIHFYGSIADESSHEKTSALMDANSEVGMMYKGSVTLKVIKEIAEEKPIKSIEDFKRIPSEIVDKSSEHWNVKFRMYKFYSFNDKSTKNGTKANFYVSIGKESMLFDSVNKINLIFFYIF